MSQLTPQLLGTVLIEAAMIALTTFLLVQPEPVFRGVSIRIRGAITWAGLVSLCVTFCWSVIFGCVLAIHHLTLRI